MTSPLLLSPWRIDFFLRWRIEVDEGFVNCNRHLFDCIVDRMLIREELPRID